MRLRSYRLRLIVKELPPSKPQKRVLRKRHPDALYRRLRTRLKSTKINKVIVYT